MASAEEFAAEEKFAADLRRVRGVTRDLQQDIAGLRSIVRELHALEDKMQQRRQEPREVQELWEVAAEVKKLPRLTRMEQIVLRESAQGQTAREVAAKLFVSVRTVQFHKQHIYQKLGVHTMLQAVRKMKTLEEMIKTLEEATLPAAPGHGDS